MSRLAKPVLVLTLWIASACSGSEVTSPQQNQTANLSPPRMAGAAGNGRLVIWENGETISLDTVLGELRWNDTLRVLLDRELTAKVLNGFQAVIEGDVLAPALEALAGCPSAEMCVDPYRLGDRGSQRVSPENRVFESGFSSFGGKRVRLTLSGRPGSPTGSTGEVYLATTDDCGDIAGAIYGTVTSYRGQRSRFWSGVKQALWDAGVGPAVAAAAAIGAPEMLGVALANVGADAWYAHINMGIMGGIWTAKNCGSQTLTATGFYLLPGSPPGSGGGGGGGGGGGDIGIVLYCSWSVEYVSINGKSYDVWIKTCSFHSQ